MADELGNGYPARIARLEEWRHSVDQRLTTMPSEAQVAVLTAQMDGLKSAFDQFVMDWKQEQDDERGRRATRSIAIWGWIVALTCCVIGSVTLVFVTAPHL